jgi:hypothetical protein
MVDVLNGATLFCLRSLDGKHKGKAYGRHLVLNSGVQPSVLLTFLQLFELKNLYDPALSYSVLNVSLLRRIHFLEIFISGCASIYL